MKRIFCLLAFVMALNSCDDGDLKVESFDFGNAQTAVCGLDTPNFFVYKINDNEALLVQLPEETFELEQETPVGTPIVLTIGPNVKAIYRLYSGSVVRETICSTIPASSPVVTEEWVATGGTIEIVSNAVHPVVEATGANFITGYSHTITFRNITFDTGDGNTQTNREIPFGTYITAVTVPLNFTILTTNECVADNILFKASGNQVMTLDLDTATFNSLFVNEVTVTPRISYINETNILTYRRFGTTIDQASFCAGTVPPLLEELWTAENGVEGISGIIEVSTVQIVGTDDYEHTIIFRKINFGNIENDQKFTFGTAYEFGKYVTSE